MSADPSPRDPRLAAWLVARRRDIEQRLRERAPSPSASEAEALRRFRTFATRALQTGRAPAPALDGLRVRESRVRALLEAWAEAAGEVAGPAGSGVRTTLETLARPFCGALRDTAPARRKSGAPKTGARAVRAAIDRVADGYLAIDVDSRSIVDANPAVGALLDTTRDALVGAAAESIVPDAESQGFWAQLDSLVEGADTQRFPVRLRDAGGQPVDVEISLSRHAQRNRTLALALMRPRSRDRA